MNYYEIKYPYYALISARNKEEAIKIYTDEICKDLLEVDKEDIEEVTQINAFIKFISAVNEHNELITKLGTAIDEFLDTDILLVDECLIM